MVLNDFFSKISRLLWANVKPQLSGKRAIVEWSGVKFGTCRQSKHIYGVPLSLFCSRSFWGHLVHLRSFLNMDLMIREIRKKFRAAIKAKRWEIDMLLLDISGKWYMNSSTASLHLTLWPWKVSVKGTKVLKTYLGNESRQVIKTFLLDIRRPYMGYPIIMFDISHVKTSKSRSSRLEIYL